MTPSDWQVQNCWARNSRTAGVTEFAEEVDRPAPCHVAQLHESLVRLKMGIQNFLGDLLGTVHDRLGGQHPHPAELRIKTDQGRDIGIRRMVLERIDTALRGLLDKIPVQGLPTVFLVAEPGRVSGFYGSANS
jgi:hypothetical protein